MAQATITIRIDENLKKQAEMLFEEMGMNMTTAYTIFTKAVIRQGKIPFEISANNIPNRETLATRKDVEAGRNLSKTFDTPDEMFKDLGI